MSDVPKLFKSRFYRNKKYPHHIRYVTDYAKATCVFFTNIPSSIYVFNVTVDPNNRGKGIGRKMMSEIRIAYPNHYIWVETMESARGFWEKMIDEGVINEIRNKVPSTIEEGGTYIPTNTTKSDYFPHHFAGLFNLLSQFNEENVESIIYG